MTWKAINFTCLLLVILVQGCGIYTFSGASLPSEATVFSLQLQSGTSQASLELLDDLEQRLSDTLERRTVLKQTDAQGDLRFVVVIKGIDWRPQAYKSSDDDDESAQHEQLTISVEVSYINPYDEKVSFDKKTFSERIVGDRSEASALIDKVLDQLSQAIYSAALVNW